MNTDMQALNKMLANGIQQHRRVVSHNQGWGFIPGNQIQF